MRDVCNNFLGMNTLLVCLLFAQLLTMPPLLFWSARQRFEFRYRALVAVTLLKAVLNPLLGIIAVLLYQEKDVARIISIVVVEVSIGGIISILQFAKGRVFYHKEYWKYAFFFNFPLLPHYLSGTILNQSDRIMIDKLIGRSEVALYGVAYNIGMLILLFTDAVNNSFTPWMYLKMKENKYKEIKEVGTVLISLIALLVVSLLFFAPEVIWVFGSSKYANAIQVIPPVAVTTYFIFLYVMFANIEFYYEKNKMIMVASIAAAILNIVLNAIFIPIVGYYVAAYTTLFCYILYTASHYFFSTAICKKQMRINNVFDIKSIVLISIALLCSIPFFTILYEHMILRYGLFVVLVIILYLKRSTFLSSLKRIREKNN
jgi:O-antigen/teichoic acid export membrane protein